MRFYPFLIFSVFCLNLQAGSVRLYNDTAHSLKAIIRGADGSQLGEAVVAPQAYNNWTEPPAKGPTEQPKITPKQSQVSRTPYTVIWYCPDGSDFSMNDNVATGSFITALHGAGKKTCTSAQKPPSSNPSDKVKP
ncbi:MAG: hypothetical protein EB051_01580 [Chlamydiia bacterium]|nr:hypothetical protein [Chlamydiia bacterium]